MYARATILFKSPNTGKPLNLFDTISQGTPDILFNGAIGEEVFSDPKAFCKKLSEINFVMDGVKAWYQRDRLKIDDVLSKRITYADGDMLIKSGDQNICFPISHAMTHFSNIPDQLDFHLPSIAGLKEPVAVKEDFSLFITPQNDEYGKLIFFFGEKDEWENKNGMPKMNMTVTNVDGDLKSAEDQK